MSYLGYVIAAYAVFVIVLLWDVLSARLQVRRALRQARARQQRQRGRQAATPDTELVR
ncbi:heme exporter protein CcmD [Stenotrophomonas sp. HITSZ_GD]|uniref:heme exporter protein CcmD n=1 Tax=Stenotrophomonas sp. HITSZ_GD TaxID=3037248 RepID=UPI001029E565|nr:heme exporter protein CcmD [Stenotrophomonas sp. HITSZ_GD]MDG2524412.1 heme exporter protein CcmD [Stenotrophomonas sp. HITSZ_GD]